MFSFIKCYATLLVLVLILEVSSTALLYLNLRNPSDRHISLRSSLLTNSAPATTLATSTTAAYRRHHIVHFCPTLDIARECIRTCMAKGLPAFCGKDHVCYCGHSLSSHDTAPSEKERASYKDFKDMYIKYLGVAPDGSNIPDDM